MNQTGVTAPATAAHLRALMAKRPVVGIWSLLNSPVAMDVIGRAGFDFVIIDLEHGPATTMDAYVLASIARGNNMLPIVRVPLLSQRFIQQALDWGAVGVQVPNIASRKDIEQFLSFVRYPPDGVRGLSPFVANAGFHATNTAAHCATRRANELYIPQIENKAGLACIDAVLEADIDIVFVGLYDLSRSLGETPESPVLERILEDLVKRCLKADKFLGTIASSEVQLRRHLDMGVRYVTYLADTHLLLDTLKSVRSLVR